MAKAHKTLSVEDVTAAKIRRLEAMRLQEIEGNPLDVEQIAMFEMFEREKWTHDRRLAYIKTRTKRRLATAAE